MRHEFTRYVIASLLMYAWMFGGTFVLTEGMKIAANLSYLIALTVNYVATYFLNAFYVFERTASPGNASRFVLHAAVFWLMNSVFYSAMLYLTPIHYLLLVVINVLMYTVLRFLSMRWFVFSKPTAAS